jgi:hypothetical protein
MAQHVVDDLTRDHLAHLGALVVEVRGSSDIGCKPHHDALNVALAAGTEAAA